MDAITSCIDETSEFFEWADDFHEFCVVVDPERPMNIRKQAIRMYAVLLANVCTGQLGLVASNGELVSLDPATQIEGECVDGVSTIADLMDAAETLLLELDGLPLSHDVKSAYGRLKDCMEAVNEGIGIGPTCRQVCEDDDDDDHGHGDDDGRGGDDHGDDDGHGDHGDDDQGDGDDGDTGHGDGHGDDEGDTGHGDVGHGDDSRSAQVRHEGGLDPNVYPNPLNPNTELSFYLSRDGRVRVTVYDVNGRVVRSLMDEYRTPGEQRVRWNGTDKSNQTVPSGVYFIRIQTPQGEATRRATVLK
jgi:hypothetical protein